MEFVNKFYIIFLNLPIISQEMTEENKKIKFPTEKHLQDISKDKFKYKELSANIVDNILLQMELPNNFGIYGNWGSGKSTLIHFMREHLKTKDDIQVVYFEAWKYEYSEGNDLLFALLNAIKKELKIGSKIWKKVAVSALTIWDKLLRTPELLAAIPIVGTWLSKIALDPKDIKERWEMYEEMVYSEHEKWNDKIDSLQSDFQSLVKKWLEKKKKKKEKLIIFIDDLDRCLPENAVKLLEAIKNFLSVDNTLFVMAIDKRVISQMISKKYGMLEDYGEEYLMKIIHYYYDLSETQVEEIIKEIFKGFSIWYSHPQFIDLVADLFKIIWSEVRKVKYFIAWFYFILNLKGIKYSNGETTDSEMIYLLYASIFLQKFKKHYPLYPDVYSLAKLWTHDELVKTTWSQIPELMKNEMIRIFKLKVINSNNIVTEFDYHSFISAYNKIK